jgi:hypothetical protein
MNELTAELHALAAEISAVLLPATVDPGQVLRLVTQAGTCALVDPTSSYAPLTFGGDMYLTVPVWLITAGPYDAAAVERLDDALVLAWPVTRPMEPVTRGTWQSAGADLPALLIQTPRHVPC